jgi:hypothetical protein
MTATNRDKKNARRIQEALDCSYQTALALASGEYSWTPISPNCMAQVAFRALDITPGPITKNCRCEECAKASSDSTE